MKYWTKSKIFWIALLTVVALAIPFAINELYKMNCGYITVWGGADVFSFYGDIIGAIATIIGVYFTIDYSNFKNKEDEIKSVKPSLFTEYCPIYDYEQFSSYDSYTTFVLMDREWNISTMKMFVPPIVRKVINRQNKMKEEKDVERFRRMAEQNISFMKEYYLIQYEISNVGSGNAMEIDMLINGKQFINKYPICTEHKVIFKFIVDMRECLIKEEKELNIVLQYSDIYGKAQYQQQERIRIFRDEDNTLSSRQQNEDILSEQRVKIN